MLWPEVTVSKYNWDNKCSHTFIISYNTQLRGVIRETSFASASVCFALDLAHVYESCCAITSISCHKIAYKNREGCYSSHLSVLSVRRTFPMSPQKISPQFPWTQVRSLRKPMWTLGSRLGKEDAEVRWGEWHPGKITACGRGIPQLTHFFLC